MLPPFKGITLGNGDATERQIQDRLREIYAVGILSGHIVDIVLPSIASTDLIIDHLLLRQATGFILVSVNAAGIVYLSPTVNPTPDRTLILRSNVVSLRAKLWIF